MQLIDNDVARKGLGALREQWTSVSSWLVGLQPSQRRALVLAVLIVCLGAAPISLGTMGDQPAERATSLATSSTASVDRSGQIASRSYDRDVEPVAGLTQTQMDHATTIVRVGEQMKMPKEAYVVAVATSMQETNLRNLANTGLPVSESLPNDGTGYDHDSVGLFQQRPASGWGSVDELMDPATSARKFYQALDQVPGWQGMPVTVAAQTVQGSAFPDAYAKHQQNAETVVDAITK